MAVFVSSSGGSQQTGQVTAYQVGQASPSLPFYFGGAPSQPSPKTFSVPLPDPVSDPFAPIPEDEEPTTMSRCGGTNATGSPPAGSGVISANPLSGEEINVTPGIVTTAERAREAARAAMLAQEEVKQNETPSSWRAFLESAGLQDVPPLLLLVILILTFAALRR